MRRWFIILVAVAILVTVLHFAWPVEPAQHWVAIRTGELNGPHLTQSQECCLSPYYGFFSGFGGILERLIELIVLGGILLFKVNCHHKRCPWVGRYPDVEGKGWKYCRRHHATDGVQKDDSRN